MSATMRHVVAFFALCLLLLKSTHAAPRVYGPYLTGFGQNLIRSDMPLPSIVKAQMNKPPVKIIKSDGRLKVEGPLVKDGFNCDELLRLFSREAGSLDIPIFHCTTRSLFRAKVRSIHSFRKWVYYDIFAAGLNVIWESNYAVNLHKSILFTLFDLWGNGYYLRGSIKNCYVPFATEGYRDEMIVTAVLLAFPHCIGKLPEDTITSWSGLKIFETFYYKTLVEINELAGNGWLYFSKDKVEDELAPLYAEYSEYESQGLSIDNYKKWLTMPFRVLSATQTWFVGIPRDFKRQQNINTIFTPESMNMQDGVLDSMKSLFGNTFALTEVERRDRMSYHSWNYCSNALPQPSYVGAWYPYTNVSPRDISSSSGTSNFFIYDCALSLVKDGFSVVVTKRNPSFVPLNRWMLAIGPHGMELHSSGLEITDILYEALREFIKAKFFSDILPTTPDSIALLRSALQDEMLVECYSKKVCDSVYVERPERLCSSTYKDKNGVLQNIEERIVEACSSFTHSKSNELHIWTTTDVSESIQERLKKNGNNFIALDVATGGHPAIIVFNSGLDLSLMHMDIRRWPKERGPLFTKLRELTKLHALMEPFCTPKVVSFDWVKRIVCLSNSLDADTIQYEELDSSKLGETSTLQLQVVQAVVGFSSIQKINGRSEKSDMSKLSRICDMSVFETIGSMLTELVKEIDGQSETFNVLWKFRQMFENRIDDNTYTQSGRISFRRESSDLENALSIFDFSQRSGISFKAFRCWHSRSVQCDLVSNSFPLPHIISKHPSREELLHYMDVHTKLGELLWDDQYEIKTAPNWYTIMPSQSESNTASNFLYAPASAHLSSILSAHFTIPGSISTEKNLKIADVRRAVLQVMNGEYSTDNPLANSINSMLSYSHRPRSGDYNLLNVSFSSSSWKHSSIYDAIELISKLRKAGVDVNLKADNRECELLLEIAVSEEYTEAAAKLTNDAVLRVILSKIMQGLRLNELLQHYMDGLVVQVDNEGELTISSTERVHLKLLNGRLTAHISDEHKTLMVLSMIGKQLFKWDAKLFDTYSYLRTILRSINIEHEADIYSSLDLLVVGTSKYMDSAKNAVKIIEQQCFLDSGHVISTHIITEDHFMRAYLRGEIMAILEQLGILRTVSDTEGYLTKLAIAKDEDWVTRPSLIKKLLILTDKLLPYGFVARACPGKHEELLRIQVAGPFNSNDDVRHYFEGKCVDVSLFSEGMVEDVLVALRPQEDDEKTRSTVQPVVDLGNIDDYVLQSIGLISSYMGPDREITLETFNEAELDEFKKKIGFPEDGSVAAKDLLSAWDEVEELGIRCNEPLSDDYPATPETLSAAAKLVYRVLYTQLIEMCPICLSNMFVADDSETMVTACGHAMHCECCRSFKVADPCPMCRKPLY